MKLPYRVALAFALVLVTVVGFLWNANHRSPGAAAKYKAQLRAQGEKISFAELGFPRQPESADGIVRLTNAVGRISTISTGKFQPAELMMMTFVGPGRVRITSLDPAAMLYGATNRMNWDEIENHLRRAGDELGEIRSALEHPVSCFNFNPTNSPFPPYPFVAMRNAAQWLGADTLGALHTQDRDRALKNMEALLHLIEFNRDDWSLVAQMIRVAIAGLALSVTWEVLQSPDLTEADLAAIQQHWERVDLLKAAETSFLGERAFGELVFTEIRLHGARRAREKYLGSPKNPSIRSRLEAIRESFLWNLGGEEDELLLLRHHQGALECMRDLQQGKSWPEVRTNSQALIARLQNAFSGIRIYRYPVSARAIPNHVKAFQSVVRNETQRRLTVVALALKRHQLRHGRVPAQLGELVPEFLSAIPIDPMSGEPLRYRLNADGRFCLYSVGDDGKDDGGDANPSSPTKSFDLWSGKDSVWPAAESAAVSP